MNPRLFNLIVKIIKDQNISKIYSFLFKFYLRDFQWNWSFSLNCSNFVNFLARKTFFSFKQVRISSEIDRYHYQSANAEPMAIVQNRIKTDPFRQVVTSEPTVPPHLPTLTPTLSPCPQKNLIWSQKFVQAFLGWSLKNKSY